MKTLATTFSRLYLIPVAILLLGIFNALFAYTSYQASEQRAFEARLQSDVNIRYFGFVSTIRKFQAELRPVLAALRSSMSENDSNADGLEQKIRAVVSGSNLVSGSEPFVAAVLSRSVSTGDVYAVSLPTRFSSLAGVNLKDAFFFKDIDWSVDEAGGIVTSELYFSRLTQSGEEYEVRTGGGKDTDDNSKITIPQLNNTQFSMTPNMGSNIVFSEGFEGTVLTKVSLPDFNGLWAVFGQETPPFLAPHEVPVDVRFAGDSGIMWRVTEGNIDIVRGAFDASEGDQAIDMNGFVPGAIEADINFPKAGLYTISFDLSRSPRALSDRALSVTLDGIALTETPLKATQATKPNQMEYQHVSLEVYVDSGGEHTLGFKSLDGVDANGHNGFGTIIDNLKVNLAAAVMAGSEEPLSLVQPFNFRYYGINQNDPEKQYVVIAFLETLALQRELDRQVALVSGEAAPLRQLIFHNSSGQCLLDYHGGKGGGACPEILPSLNQAAITMENNYGFRIVFLPTDEYQERFFETVETFPYRELFWALLLSLWSCVAVVLFLRAQASNEEQVAFERNLVSSQERVTGAVHRRVSEGLAQFSIFAETLRDMADEEDQRYVDIAVTDIVRTRLDLDTTVLMGGTSPTLLQSGETITSLRQLVARSSAYLTALTKDGEVMTRLLADDGLPESFRANPYWLESLVFALIQLASDNTDEGLIEVAFWAERSGPDNWTLYIRTRDTGIGGDLDNDSLSEPERALRLLVEFVGAEMTQNTNPNNGGLERIVRVVGVN